LIDKIDFSEIILFDFSISIFYDLSIYSLIDGIECDLLYFSIIKSFIYESYNVLSSSYFCDLLSLMDNCFSDVFYDALFYYSTSLYSYTKLFPLK